MHFSSLIPNLFISTFMISDVVIYSELRSGEQTYTSSSPHPLFIYQLILVRATFQLKNVTWGRVRTGLAAGSLGKTRCSGQSALRRRGPFRPRLRRCSVPLTSFPPFPVPMEISFNEKSTNKFYYLLGQIKTKIFSRRALRA